MAEYGPLGIQYQLTISGLHELGHFEKDMVSLPRP